MDVDDAGSSHHLLVRLRAIPDDALLRGLSDLLNRSRRIEWALIAHIGEVDDRRLYAHEAKPSMFAYCTEVLHLSEPEAYLRITVARTTRDHPMLLDMLKDGRVHLTAISRLAPHLTLANRDVLLLRATHRSRRAIDELIAEIAPRPDVPDGVRRLADPPVAQRADSAGNHVAQGPAGELCLDRVCRPPTVGAVAASAVRTVVKPLSPARYRVQFTAGPGFCEKLDRLKELMRSSVPDGNLAAVLEAAVTEKLERLEAKRFGSTRRPARSGHARAASDVSHGRYVPAAVRRAVRKRDGNQCRFVGANGRRCTARHRLQFHHIVPWALGGETSVDNIVLMCRAHNALIAERDYGPGVMARYRRGASALGAPEVVAAREGGDIIREK